MRAFMSDATGRTAYLRSLAAVFPGTGRDAATAEGVRITLETEPKGGTGPDDQAAWYEVPLSLLGRGGNGVTRSALARSLSSWVTA